MKQIDLPFQIGIVDDTLPSAPYSVVIEDEETYLISNQTIEEILPVDASDYLKAAASDLILHWKELDDIEHDISALCKTVAELTTQKNGLINIIHHKAILRDQLERLRLTYDEV